MACRPRCKCSKRVDLSNDMTWRQMIAVGVRRVVLARGELDKLEGPKYAARRAELRRRAGEAARARDRQRRRRRLFSFFLSVLDNVCAVWCTPSERGGVCPSGCCPNPTRGCLLSLFVYAVLPSLPWFVSFLSFCMPRLHALRAGRGARLCVGASPIHLLWR